MGFPFLEQRNRYSSDKSYSQLSPFPIRKFPRYLLDSDKPALNGPKIIVQVASRVNEARGIEPFRYG